MITDTEARRIASSWHGGGGTALYAFASTGAIDTARADHDIKNEIQTCYFYPDDMPGLRSLLAYVVHHGKRGPVPGWADLT